MFWELKSVVEGIKGEYRGWHKFKEATGIWPVYSMVAGIFSIPVCFASVVYCLVTALGTGRLPIIYTALFAAVSLGAIVWYGLRVFACNIDVARVQRCSTKSIPIKSFEKFIR
jgi:hypothetical protein